MSVRGWAVIGFVLDKISYIIVIALLAWLLPFMYNQMEHKKEIESLNLPARAEFVMKDVNGHEHLMSCPIFYSKPAGAHGRECYIKGSINDKPSF